MSLSSTDSEKKQKNEQILKRNDPFVIFCQGYALTSYEIREYALAVCGGFYNSSYIWLLEELSLSDFIGHILICVKYQEKINPNKDKSKKGLQHFEDSDFEVRPITAS